MAFEPMKFSKNALMEWNDNKISDHNRSDLGVNVERIQTTKRMANGTLRKYVVADKRSFSVSWDNLPHSADFTVDGFWGGREIEAFYASNAGAFKLKITNGDGLIELVDVVFKSFDKNINKRGAYDFWDVNIEMDEV
jgi:hypothetical protein